MDRVRDGVRLSRRELHFGQRPGEGACVEVAGLDDETDRVRDGVGLSRRELRVRSASERRM